MTWKVILFTHLYDHRLKRDFRGRAGDELDEIMKSKVVLKGKDKDEGKDSLRRDGQADFRISMFTTLEMKKRFLQNPHEESTENERNRL